MGIIFSSFFSKLFGNKEVRILLLGLDNAGKTTTLYKLYNPNRVVRTTPTIGFNIETVTYKNLTFSMWDLGGQSSIRPYWRSYFHNTNAVIYVVDSADKDRIGIAMKELFKMFEEEELKNCPILVFANKADDPHALSEADVAKELNLISIKDRQWHIQKSAAIKGEGLTEGLDWLANAITSSQ